MDIERRIEALQKKLVIPSGISLKSNNKGIGLYANKLYKKGDLIYTDKALISINLISLNNDVMDKGFNVGLEPINPSHLLSMVYYILRSPELIESITELSQFNGTISEIELNILKDLIPNDYNQDNMEELVERVYRVCRVNGYNCITSLFGMSYLYALFPLSSMINHSCNPNTIQYYQKDNMILIADRDITINEEICISYGGYSSKMSHVNNSSKLGFICKCEYCISLARGDISSKKLDDIPLFIIDNIELEKMCENVFKAAAEWNYEVVIPFCERIWDKYSSNLKEANDHCINLAFNIIYKYFKNICISRPHNVKWNIVKDMARYCINMMKDEYNSIHPLCRYMLLSYKVITKQDYQYEYDKVIDVFTSHYGLHFKDVLMMDCILNPMLNMCVNNT